MKIVPDTSVIVDGRITGIVQEDEFRGSEVIVPEAVVSELEYQANRGRETGFNGLEELKNLQELHRENIISLIFVGRRPTLDEISLARGGEIDSMIRETAREYDALLITSDRVQAEVGKAQGLDVFYIKPEVLGYEELEISKYFDEYTMSVHLKENVAPMAKKGRPGNIKLVKIDDRPLKHSDINRMAREIVERAKSDFKSFIEIEMEGATVVQFREYRISIARPPFSEAFEITAVRPRCGYPLRTTSYLTGSLKGSGHRQGCSLSQDPGAGRVPCPGCCRVLQQGDEGHSQDNGVTKGPPGG